MFYLTFSYSFIPAKTSHCFISNKNYSYTLIQSSNIDTVIWQSKLYQCNMLIIWRKTCVNTCPDVAWSIAPVAKRCGGRKDFVSLHGLRNSDIFHFNIKQAAPIDTSIVFFSQCPRIPWSCLVVATHLFSAYCASSFTVLHIWSNCRLLKNP